MGFHVSLCKFHKNSLIERLLEGKTVTLWDELSEKKPLSKKASLKFLTEGFFFFTIALYGLPEINLQIPQEQPYRKASWGESCISGRWINRTQRSFSESFFAVLNWRYFLFHNSTPWASKYHFANFTRTDLVNAFLRGKVWLCEMN